MDEAVKTPAAVSERPDKRRTPPRGDRPVNFRLMPAGFVPPFAAVTAVATVAFTADGNVVAAEEHRGPDLPGGHVQEGEETAEETARREAEEETGIKLGTVHFLRAIESDRYGSAPDELTYMVIMAAVVTEQGPVPSGMTRHIMTPEQFHLAHRGLRKEMLRELVDAAKKLLFP
ncbi:MAG: NUDIX domain-containing protein [Cyanobacteria bacterium SZAS TMP-1]|nr:NUDIX domain-containing protein [Cyanobacteria bacterium SZAS TMP-1]